MVLHIISFKIITTVGIYTIFFPACLRHFGTMSETMFSRDSMPKKKIPTDDCFFLSRVIRNTCFFLGLPVQECGSSCPGEDCATFGLIRTAELTCLGKTFVLISVDVYNLAIYQLGYYKTWPKFKRFLQFSLPYSRGP